MYNNKYLKYKKKYLSLKAQIAGGEKTRNIADLQQTITNQEFRNDINENSIYYNSTCLHTKLSDLEIARNLHKKTLETSAQNERVRRRMEEITTNPAVVLSEQEYAQLTPQQKALGWVSFTEGPQWDTYTRWRRQTPQDRQAVLERTVEWKIQNNPAVVLSEQEYAQLTPQQKALGWVSFTEGPQWDSYTRWRRQTPQDRQREINNQHNRNIQTQMNNILSRGTQHQITKFPVVVPELAIRDDNYTYVQLSQAQYNEYKRLEAQLRK